MTRVIFDHVTKCFGSTVAVHDLNMDIESGEFIVLVGPSGCGKTTSLRMLAGLETITSGDLYIGERNVKAVPPKDRDVAMVFQSYALYPHMTVAENMSFALKLSGSPQAEIEHRVKSVAGRLGIEPLLNRKPKELSGGQQQRVALGRAMIRNPAVFLMDEPLSNLDPKLRIQARAEITKLFQQLGKTFVYVTHDQVEAMTLGTRIAVMDKGILQQIASPEDLYQKPKNVFVAEFMGSPSMNLFNVSLTQKDHQLVAQTEGISIPLSDRIRQTLGNSTISSDRDVILGIRPEDIYDPDQMPFAIDSTPIQGRVIIRELLGHEVILHLQLGHPSGLESPAFLVRLNSRSQIKIGDHIELLIDRDRLHFFDRESQLRIV